MGSNFYNFVKLFGSLKLLKVKLMVYAKKDTLGRHGEANLQIPLDFLLLPKVFYFGIFLGA